MRKTQSWFERRENQWFAWADDSPSIHDDGMEMCFKHSQGGGGGVGVVGLVVVVDGAAGAAGGGGG